MKEQLNILIFGAGAVGASVGAWVAEKHESVWFYDKKEILEDIERDGITYYEGGERKSNIKVKVAYDLDDIPEPDVIAVAVKNYSLDGVCKFLQSKYGDGPIIIGLQNGIENQSVLPKYFSKNIFCVICFNAWLDSPGVVGYQKRGPLVFGALDDSVDFEMKAVARVFNKGVETIVVDHLQDAAHSKMIINLTNSLTTLIGHGFKELSDKSLLQKTLSNLTYEGVKIVKAAGYSECKLGGMPSWTLITAAVKLPQFITKAPFEKNLKKMVVSSMAQDIIQRGGTDSELETINGYFLKLADKHNVSAPYNRTVYELCKERFAAPGGFKPMDIKEVYAEIEKNL